MTDLYLVDASIYVFRGYFSLPTTFTSVDGQVNHALRGYAQFLADFLAHKPARVAVAFDESLNTCFRNDIYPDYKANRDLPDDNLLWQFEQCRALTGLLGLHYLNERHYEADDLIGTLSKRFGDGHRVIIVTRDKDLGQVLRQGDLVWDFAADDYQDSAAIKDKLGVAPQQIADYLALAGDSVDNIPGATGIGAKTAAALLARFDTLDGIYDNLANLAEAGIRGAKRAATTLAEQEALIRTYRRITAIKQDVPLTVSLADLQQRTSDAAACERFCKHQGFSARVTGQLLAGLRT